VPHGFQPADYVFAAAALILVAMGLFRGLSGVVAIVAATAAASAVSAYGWPYTAQASSETWVRFVMTGAAALVAFGIVRIAVRKIVNGLLAQPADSIAGVLVGLAAAAAILFAASRFECARERSLLAREVAAHVG
jgi:hypothetical protein